MKTSSSQSIAELLAASRQAGQKMAALSRQQKDLALQELAGLLLEKQGDLLQANARDRAEHHGRISDSLYQRLGLDPTKLAQLVAGIRDLAALPDPVGQTLSRTVLDDDLILEKVAAPLGVVAVIFESRPDVVPQILSLILKSGNAVVLKGGSEAAGSNRAFMKLVEELGQRCPWLPPGWASLLEGREAALEALNYPEYVDLVIPRGSNQLVRSIMQATRIPVLGHAEGVCHLYVHAAADLKLAADLAVDAKAQYPAACNSIETLLADQAVAAQFLPMFAEAAGNAGIRLKGCAQTRQILPQAETATEEDWRTEYGDKTLSVRVVSDLRHAVDHINRYGSHHTDAIVTRDPEAGESFLNAVDSASVMLNASTRFADGYRYGLGAELGISTARTHARGPVGLEGLMTYKYKLRGKGQKVASYVGPQAKAFKHLRDES